MALIKCPECGREISDKAKRCPECGRELHKVKSKSREISQKYKMLISFGVFILVIVGILFFILRDYVSFQSKNAPNGQYLIADGIYMGMSKQEARNVLSKNFSIYEGDESDNFIDIFVQGTKDSPPNENALEYFNIRSVGTISLIFDNKNYLEEVQIWGSKQCESFEDWCLVLGQEGVRKHKAGCWYKGHVNLQEDIIMLIAYDNVDCIYCVNIMTAKAAQEKIDYDDYF